MINSIINHSRNRLFNTIIPRRTLISSEFQTKDWRKSQKWYIDGRRNECEIYQKKEIEKIISNENFKIVK